MLGKTLMLGVISASAALGIVYFGTAPQGSEAAEAHPHDDKAMQSSVKTPEKTKSERIEPRLPTIRKGDKDERETLAYREGLAETPAAESRSENGSETRVETRVESNNDMPPSSAAAETVVPEKQTRWLDQYLKKNKDDGVDAETKALKVKIYDTPDTDKDAGKDTQLGNPAGTESTDGVSGDAMKAQNNNEDSATEDRASNESPTSDSRIFRIEDGKLVEITPEGAIDFADSNSKIDALAAEEESKNEPVAEADDFVYKADELPSDTTPLLSTVMAEAQQIKKAELRDQAYFEITEYALSEGRYDSARMAHNMIEQEELSYTAKSRMAVAFAQNGMPSKAFKVIEEVDEPELRDFMRLQVIEALIAPQNLPEMWQEKNN